MKLLSSLYGAAALVSLTEAQNSTFCTSTPVVCYAVNVPASTASNANGTGDIFFQITGPSTMSWMGFGQGTQMAGSNIFVIYADASGTNVTLSPRLGVGEVEPMEDMTADVTLLSGSGIANGVMTANVKCTNCNTWTGGSMSFTDPQSNWIWAHLTGPPISSDSKSANIIMHDIMGTTTLNLVSAAGGSLLNPFGTNISTTSTTNSASGSSMSTSSTASSPTFKKVLEAHAILASLAFVVLFPVGAIALRLVSGPSVVWVHAAYMIFVYLIVFAALGMGIWMAVTGSMLDTTHAIIGLVVLGSLLLQPLTGFVHHLMHKRRGRPDLAENLHVWWGRAIIVLGIINGGLGLKLAGNSTGGEMAYGIIAGIIGLAWIIILLIVFVNNRGVAKNELGETGKKVYRNRRMREKEVNGASPESHSEADMRQQGLAISEKEKKTLQDKNAEYNRDVANLKREIQSLELKAATAESLQQRLVELDLKAKENDGAQQRKCLELDSLKCQLSKLQTKNTDGMRSSKQEPTKLKTRSQSLETSNTVLIELKKTQEGDIAKLGAEKSVLKELESSKSELNKKTTDMEEAKSESIRLAEQLRLLTQSHATKIKELQKELESSKGDLGKKTTDMEEYKKTQAVAVSRLEMTITNFERPKREAEQQRDQIRRLDTLKNQHEREINSLRKQLVEKNTLAVTNASLVEKLKGLQLNNSNRRSEAETKLSNFQALVYQIVKSLLNEVAFRKLNLDESTGSILVSHL